MDKKVSIVIVVIALALIIAGAYLIFTNYSSGEVTESDMISFKTHDFKLFSMDVPDGSDFKLKNEADGMKYYLNSGNYSSNFTSIILSRDMTDSLIGDNVQSISNTSSSQIYSFSLKNETSYKYVSAQGDVDIIITGNDLNLLKEAADTIEIKDVNDI